MVLNEFAVGTNGRYLNNQQGKGETYCNIYVWDATRAMGAEIPHWVDNKGTPAPAGALGTRELSANGAIAWLRTYGQDRGWRPVNAVEAQAQANLGSPVVATLDNPGGIGHVAMVRPGEYTQTDGPQIAQAGGVTFNEGSVKDGFGDRKDRVVYYVHE